MIEFRDVKKTYPNGTVALDGVNLKIADGEFVFIVGESGAGKTTLMKLLLREEKVTSGRLIVRVNRTGFPGGQVPSGNTAEIPRVGTKPGVTEYDLSKISNFKVPYYRRELGVVFQDFRLFPNKTVFENVAFAMQVIGESNRVIKRRVPAILNIVNLTEKFNCYPSQLSGGEQQRVALARALANNPQIIIADEPTGNIDPKMSLEIMNLLVKIHKRGKTVIVVTHEKDLVDYFRQRVIKISDGRVVSDGVGGMFG
ncbi:MAG: ATP-binding cassette domain-containing protein [Clostridia bacterium]|nr:ATP-binding cassette domain-containing protein [Clostridia bacterium]